MSTTDRPRRMTHGHWPDMAMEEAFAGVRRRRIDGESATILQYEFDPGGTHGLHAHEQEQLMLVERGLLTLRVEDDGQVVDLVAGDWSIVASHARHGVTAGPEGGAMTVVIAPRRTEEYETDEP
jgi:quercetin dioxygenase-like cupin family protein